MAAVLASGMRRLNVAIIGSGDVAQLHLAGLGKLDNVKLYGVASQNVQEAERAAIRYQFEKYTGDYSILLEDPLVDVVHVMTPNATHLKIVSDVLSAGKHVVAEKPLGLDVEEARSLQALAKRSGLVCAVNYHYRYFPQVQRARTLILDDQLGNLRMVQGAFLQDWLSRDTDFNWRLGEKGGGVVTDIGCHWFDLLEYISGDRVERVYAKLKTAVPLRFSGDQQVTVAQPDSGTILFDLKGGASGAVTLSQVSPGRKNQLKLEVSGSERSLAWDVEQANDLWIGARAEDNRLAQRPGDYIQVWGGGVATLLSNAYDAIRSEDSSPRDYPQFSDAVRSHLLTQSILESAQAERWVSIPAE